MANLNLKAGDNITLVKDGDDLEISSHQDETSEIIVSPTEPNTGEEVWFKTSNNLININKTVVNVGTTLSKITNGIRATQIDNGQYRWGTIKLPNELLGKTVTLNSTITPSASNSGRIAMFFADSNNDPIQEITYLSQTGNTTFTISSSFPSGTNGIVLLLYSNLNGTGQADAYIDYTNLQLVYGSNTLPYEDYIDKKIYTKNDNGVYEKFYDENEIGKEVYSTEETRIGTWIDGKPLYRKVIVVNNFTQTSGTISVDLRSLNIATIVSAFANGNWSTGGGMSYPYNVGTNDYGSIAINDGWLALTYSYPDTNQRVVYVFLQYTKTTD